MGYAFVSYSAKQQKDADALRYLLHQHDIHTWMAPYDIPEGNDYGDVVSGAIQNAACVVLLLTEDAQNSAYVDKEIERALHYGKTIAPIQLDRVELNDSFSFYLCNQQIIMMPVIDADAPKMQSLLGHLQYLCNDKLPKKDAPVDADRDKRVRRQSIAKLFRRVGAVLLCFSLIFGYTYTERAEIETWMEMYGRNIPTLPVIAGTYAWTFLLAVAALLLWLYGRGLKDPQKQSWNPVRVFSSNQILPAFSAFLGVGFGMLYFAQRTVRAVVRGLENYAMSTDGYDLPRWITFVTWSCAIAWLTTGLLSLVLAIRSAKRNGFTACRSLFQKLWQTVRRWKGSGK